MPGKCRDRMLFIDIPEKFRFKAEIFDYSEENYDEPPIVDVELICYKTGHILYNNGNGSENYRLIPYNKFEKERNRRV